MPWLLVVAALIAGAAVAWVLARRVAATWPALPIWRRADGFPGRADGALSQLADSQQAAQTHLQTQLAERLQAQERAVAKLLEERLGDMTRRVGENLQKTSEKSAETMHQLHERLAVIDAGPAEPCQPLERRGEPAGHSVQQAGPRRHRPDPDGRPGAQHAAARQPFSFQHGLSNGKRADCVIHLPNPPGLIVVDSKYPLEAYVALTKASDEPARRKAEADFKTAVTKHIRDIAEKYIVPGETADSAIMFVPAESVFATLHDRFPDLVQAGFRARVYVVSADDVDGDPQHRARNFERRADARAGPRHSDRDRQAHGRRGAAG